MTISKYASISADSFCVSSVVLIYMTFMNLDLEVQDHLAPSGYLKLPNVSGQLWGLGFTIYHIIKVAHSYFFFFFTAMQLSLFSYDSG